MSFRTQLLGLTLLSVLASPLSALAAPSYSMTFLPPTVAQAVGIDNQGRIAVTYTEPFLAHAGLWSANGTITDLGDLGGGISVAFGISTNGYVSGYSEIGFPSYAPHAFVYAHGTMTDLGTLGGLRSIALAVNASGQATGESGAPGGQHAFLYSRGVMYDLGTLGGNASQGTAINNSGVVVGWSSLAGPQPALVHAFRYAHGRMIDLGTLEGGTYSSAQAINDAGLIAGVSNGAGFEDSTHAFLYENGVMTDIGTLGGRVLVHDINERGQVVGRSGDVGFLYTGGRMIDLNTLIDCTLGWRIRDALGINNAEQIVALVSNAEGATRFVRLDRIPGASDAME